MNLYWIAYVTIGLAVGLIVGWIYGQRSGFTEGWNSRATLQRTAHQIRGQKAAETRRNKKNPSIYAESGVKAP